MKHPTNIDFLSVGNECNLNCSHCYYQEAGLRTIPISDQSDLIEKIMANYSEQAFFIYPKEIGTSAYLVDAMKSVSQKSILSNGTLITPELARRAVENGIETVKITLFSTDSQQSTFYNVSGYHTRVQESIKYCLDAGLNVTVSSVLTKTTIKSLGELLSLCRKLKVGRIELYRIKPIGNGCDKFKGEMIDVTDMLEAIRIVEQAKETFGKELHISFMTDFGVNFYGKTIDQAKDKVKRSNETWTKAPYICPAIGGNYWGVSLKTGNLYWCFSSISRADAVIGTVNLSTGVINLNENSRLIIDKLRTNLRGNCSQERCRYQEVCMGGCRNTAMLFARISGDKDPFFAGMDICLTNCYEQFTNSSSCFKEYI